MSQIQTTQRQNWDVWSTDGLETGIVDLYARRMAAVSAQQEVGREQGIDRSVMTQPFGRPFTAQPAHIPDLFDTEPKGTGRLVGWRRKLSGGSAAPRRKLATS